MTEKIRLTVTTGPDRGKSEAFEKGPIKVGRDQSNEFVLSDGFVSNFHGRITVDENRTFHYEDLNSRHGSLLALPEEGNKRTDVKKNQICNGAMLYIGCTEILITLIKKNPPISTEFEIPEIGATAKRAAFVRPRRLPNFESEIDDPNEHTSALFVTSTYDRHQSVATKIGTSERILDLFFDLSGKLNAATSLDEVLDLIVETTFEAFPSANYFSITMLDEEGSLEPSPYISRLRGKPTKGRSVDEELITSRSIMLRVLQKREGILVANNDADYDPSKSMFMAQISASMCVPLIGQHSLLGVLQVETRGKSAIFTEHELDILTLLGSSVAFAIERAQLSGNLEEILEKFVDASVTAIEARDPTTAGHSHRVAYYTLELAKEVNLIKNGPWGSTLLSQEELRELRYASLLHDFGKICVHENVLQKATRLPDGGIDQIGLRFELIASIVESESFRRLMTDQSHRLRTETPEDLLYEHDVRVSKFKYELDQDYKFLVYINSAPFLKDEEILRLKQIASRSYTTPSGEPRPYITSDELENLSIRRGTLNEREWIEMRSHAQRSEEYLQQIPWTKNLSRIPCIAGAHHEKLDGSGYPRGLTAEDLPVQVRMMTIADIFDALTASDRPYRRAAPKEGALQVLYAEANDGKLDLDLVKIFDVKVVPALKL